MSEDSKKIYDGIVLYADGSYMQRTGKLGGGIHGYTYSKEEPKKGAGTDKDILTQFGYAPKASKGQIPQVTPLNYIDIVAPTESGGSNNTAEIYAATVALEHCARYKTSHEQEPKITLYTDSMYVVDGVNKNLARWVRDRWIKGDGTEVKNRPHWERLLASFTPWANVEVKWVKGHKDSLGNILADKLADIGRLKSEANNYEIDTQVSEPDGYWKKGTERHPLLALNASFFYTSGAATPPAEYYLTNMVKSDKFIGVASGDMCVGVVRLKEADKTLELVRARQMEFDPGYNTMVLIRLDRIFAGQKADDLKQYGKFCLVSGTRALATDLYFSGETSKMHSPTEGTPITESLYPPRIADRVGDEAAQLQELLTGYLSDGLARDDIVSIDITDKIFELPAGKKGYEFVESIRRENEKITIHCEAFGQALTIPLTFNVSLINKTNIRRFANNQGEVKVLLLIQKDTDNLLRYFTMVIGKDEYSIWSSPHANTIFPKVLKDASVKA